MVHYRGNGVTDAPWLESVTVEAGAVSAIGGVRLVESREPFPRAAPSNQDCRCVSGQSFKHRVRAPHTEPLGGRHTVEVIGAEKKWSDVNLAVHLPDDGWLDAYDCELVMSNHSDLSEAIRLVREQHGKRIGLEAPETGRPSQRQMKHAEFVHWIRVGGFRHSHPPDPIPGMNIRKPAAW